MLVIILFVCVLSVVCSSLGFYYVLKIVVWSLVIRLVVYMFEDLVVVSLYLVFVNLFMWLLVDVVTHFTYACVLFHLCTVLRRVCVCVCARACGCVFCCFSLFFIFFLFLFSGGGGVTFVVHGFSLRAITRLLIPGV